MTNILLVEDDKEIVKNLSLFLQEEGFRVRAVSGQKDALEQIEEHGQEIDLVLLDVSLQDGNGFAVCAAVKANTEIPVIFLTASGDEYSTVTGLDMGADDYISKPFRPRELISRMKGVLRRCGRTQAVLELGDVRVDTLGGTVTKNGQETDLGAGDSINLNDKYQVIVYYAYNPEPETTAPPETEPVEETTAAPAETVPEQPPATEPAQTAAPAQ